MTAEDKEIAKNIFSKVLAKYSSPAVDKGNPQVDTISKEPLSKQCGQDGVPVPRSSVEKVPNIVHSLPTAASEPSTGGSETSVARALMGNEVSHSLPGSTTRSSRPSATGARRKSTRLENLPCPVCQMTPFHLRYRCPVIIAGPDSIRKRLEELESQDAERYKDLIGELERMIVSRSNASGRTRTSNVNPDSASSSITGHSEQQTRSDASDHSADHPPQTKILTHGSITDERRSREDESPSDDSYEESEVTILPITKDQPTLRLSPPCANINLDEIVNGPVGLPHSLDDIIDAVIDEEANTDGTEMEQVELDEEDEDEGFDAKFRRFSRRLAKDMPSSEEEESEDDDIEEISGAQFGTSHQDPLEALSFQAMTNGDTTSDVDENNLEFTEGLAAVLNSAASMNGRGKKSAENEPSNDVVRPSTSSQPNNGSSQSSKKANTGPVTAKSATVDSIDSTMPPPEDTNLRASVERQKQIVTDRDPIQPAEDFSVIEKAPRTSLVGRMRTRNATKASLLAATEAVPLRTSQVRGKGGPQTKQNDSTTPGSRQKPTTNPEPSPAPPANPATSDTSEAVGPSATQDKASRIGAEKPDTRAKTLASKAEALASTVTEKGRRKSTGKAARPVVVIPSAPLRRVPSQPPPPSLDKWATLSSAHDDDSVADQLHSSSQTEQENVVASGDKDVAESADAPVIEQASDAADTVPENPLFLPSESQTPFPYSQWKGNATQEVSAGNDETPAVISLGSESETEKAVKSRKPPRRRSSISYRSLTDIAKQKALFSAPASSPATHISQRSTQPSNNGRLGNLGRKHALAEEDEEEEEGSDSDSSQDDKASHIPKARLAGATVRSQKAR